MTAIDAERMCLYYGDGLAIVKTADQMQKLLEFVRTFETGNKKIKMS